MAHAVDKNAAKKPKLVRDSFTIPKNEFAAIDALKARAISLGLSVKKSELLRAGLMVLQGLNDAAYKAALAAVPTLKTGRPASEKPAEAEPAKRKAVVKPAAKPAVKPAVKPAAKPAAKAAAKPAPRKTAAPRKAA
ncbi:MAG: hypothetical protein IBJ04_15735 [Hydrogenophaga sp.]|uniref:hypothetical protein n=1 Tax=Hydrogenophaga sp. TaxID=1904254 RepID=UPI00338E2563|nr:hypothetical protein [Hydrogenophaga sp.]